MRNNYTVLSLDLGSTIGWAVCRDKQIKYSGTHAFGVKDAHPGHRFLHFQNWLVDFVGVNEIIYEDVPRFESAGAAKVYCGFLAILQIFCLANGIRMTAIKSNTVKKEFTGKGNASKEEICAKCHSIGWKNGAKDTRLDNDEADAIAAMFVVLSRRDVQINLSTN